MERNTVAAALPDHLAPPLEIRLFGPLEVRLHGSPLPRLRSRKGHWLIALLALRAGREVERAWLVSTLWPDSTEEAALANLRNSLVDLRHALGDLKDRLRSPTPYTLSLDLSGADADVLAFDQAIARGDVSSLEQAVALYRGPLLEDCAEAWAFEERQVREQAYLAALDTLANRAMAAGEPAASERYLRRAVAVDPLRESAQRALMETLARAGNVAAALQIYQELRLLLQRELNAEPDPATRALFLSLRSRAKPVEAAPSLGTPPRADGGSERTDPAAPEPPGGAVPLDSAFYVVRPADEAFQAAIARRDSIVLVKGARQTGKTSLLARGLQQAREMGDRVAFTDLQTLNAADLETVEAFLLALAQSLAVELELEVWPRDVWRGDAGPNMNLDLYLRRELFAKTAGPIVWGLDEVDRLFNCPFGTEVFGLFRSWYNRRHVQSTSPWSRLTLAMAYATEAHLFITDLNQSPFNVGTRLELGDFTRQEVADLNRRHASPLRNDAEIERFYQLLGGQPYLTRRAFYEMAAPGLDLDAITARADQEHGPFGDHLHRLLVSLTRDPGLCEAVREVLAGRPCPSDERFYRLRTAGVLSGDSARAAQPRCGLYAAYLSRHLVP
jgi:DNA-binding SARP family transcriptional activator